MAPLRGEHIAALMELANANVETRIRNAVGTITQQIAATKENITRDIVDTQIPKAADKLRDDYSNLLLNQKTELDAKINEIIDRRLATVPATDEKIAAAEEK